MSNRKISDSKLAGLLESILDNRALKKLDLSRNRIKTLGFSVLVDKMAYHPSLEVVNLDHNYLDEQIFGVLKTSVNKLKSLKLISVQSNRGIHQVEKFKSILHFFRRKNIKIKI